MIYKRISTALCLATFLSAATMRCSTDIMVPVVTQPVTQSPDSFLQTFFTKILSYTDPIVDKIGFKSTASFMKVSTFLLIIIPLIKYITNGKKFDAASSDEELDKALKEIKGKLSLKSLKSLSKELIYKLIRILRSRIGHRSYLITIKTEKTKNNDGSTISIEELKTVSATGWCKYVEDSAEHLIFVVNSAIGLSAIRNLAQFMESGDFIENTKGVNVKYNSYH